MRSFPSSLLSFLLFVSFSLFVLLFPARSQAQVALETLAKQAILIDFQTGQVLFSKNADERMPTSSMSKTMTMYLVFEALKEGKLSLDQTLPVSEKAWRTQGSKMFVDINAMVRVEDLIKGVIVQSGNDATIVLAEGLAGTEEAFAQAMNAKARELGMNNTHFMNASGWPDPDHYSTARDLAVLTMALIRDFPEDYKYYSIIDFTYNNIKQGNRNPLLYKNIGADGVKTGHTEEGGYGLIGSAVRNGRRVIMVLNGMASMNERAQESPRLMEWGVNSFENIALIKKDQKIVDIPVVMGVTRRVSSYVDKTLLVTVPRMGGNTGGNSVQAVFKTPLEAPIRAGDSIGVVRVNAVGMPPVEVPLLAGEDVQRLGFFPALVEKAIRLVFGEDSSEAVTTH